MRTIFLDRDGVINRNKPDHIKSWAEFEFLPGSLGALRRLKLAGFEVFVITNQAVINRGILKQAELDAIHFSMKQAVSLAGGNITAVLCCPHRSEENCACRKPRPGLIRQAELHYGVNARKSWLVGDHLNDITAGELTGCNTILVRTGRGEETYKALRGGAMKPELLVAPDLSRAVDLILAATSDQSY